MTYDMYRYIYLGSAGLAVLFLVIAIIVFLVYRIPSVIGDLSGSTARKAIEDIRSQNESTGDKAYKPSYVSNRRGRITDKITPSGSLVPSWQDDSERVMETTKIDTTVLESEARESYESSLRSPDYGETTLLDYDSGGETSVLSYDYGSEFEIEYELSFIHSDEVIV